MNEAIVNQNEVIDKLLFQPVTVADFIRKIVKKLFITYLVDRSKRADVLSLMSSMLQFSTQENDVIGLSPQKKVCFPTNYSTVRYLHLRPSKETRLE